MKPGWMGAHREEVEGKGDQMKRTSYTKMQRCRVLCTLWSVSKGWERISAKGVLGTKCRVSVRVKSRMKLAFLSGFVYLPPR